MENNAQLLADIKQRFFVYRNGLIADTLRQHFYKGQEREHMH